MAKGKPFRSAKKARRIHRETPDSRGEKTVWLYGRHAVLAALDNQARETGRLVATKEAAKHLAGAPAEILTRVEIGAVLPEGAVHQGLALEARPLTSPALEDVIRDVGASAVVLILDQVTDPHNVGAVMRNAAAFGAAAVIVPRNHAPPETGALAKAASGALEAVPLVRVTNLARTMDSLKATGFWCVGLAEDAKENIAEVRPDGRIALVLGAEGKGLRRLTRERCDTMARLPTTGPIASLNVSNAAAVSLYEFRRGVKD